MFKIMIVDDNKQYAEMVASYLRSKEDIDVIGVAHDGFECIELLRNEIPDILLLDMMMKHIDGIGVLERIRHMSCQPKVIMLTALADERMVERALLKGAADYLLKPFDLECLYERIVDIGRSDYGYVMHQQKYNYNSSCDMMVGESAAVYQSGIKMGRIEKQRKPIEIEITTLLHDMGVPTHVKGYQYLRDALLRTLANPQLLECVTKELYPKIAEKYNTTPSRVERAIRHAIELAWDRGNVDLMTEYFGYTINQEKGKPTNNAFIATVTDRIRLNY